MWVYLKYTGTSKTNIEGVLCCHGDCGQTKFTDKAVPNRRNRMI